MSRRPSYNLNTLVQSKNALRDGCCLMGSGHDSTDNATPYHVNSIFGEPKLPASLGLHSALICPLQHLFVETHVVVIVTIAEFCLHSG